MIRIAHTSDLHIDERGRLEDTRAVLAAFLDRAADQAVDLIVLAGDFFERRSTPTERNVLAWFLQEASEVAPVFGVKGNHDAAEDLTIFNRLDTDALVVIADRPTAMPMSATVIYPGGSAGPGFGLIALPWFDKAHLVAGLEATVDAEQTRQMTIAAARDLLTCIRAEAHRLRGAGIIPIFAGHVQVAGSEVASGQTLIGTSVELAPNDILDIGCAYHALGHIHMHQEWFGGRVAYSGSPNRCNFGEPEPKGFCLVTLTDAGDWVSNEFVELPARRMVLIEHDGRDREDLAELGAIQDGDWSDVAGAIVRLRYQVRAEDLHLVDEGAIARQLMAAGAHEVKLEAVVEAETRVRSTEIVNVQSLPEKVDAFWRAKQIEVDEPTRDRVYTKLEELEAR